MYVLALRSLRPLASNTHVLISDRSVETSLFTVNRKIAAESLDTFSKANVLRLKPDPVATWPTEFLRVCHLVLELPCPAVARFPGVDGRDMVHKAFAELTNLRILCVRYDQDKYSARQIRELAASLGGFETLKCVDLGLFEADSTPGSTRKSKIVFESRSLSRNLPKIRKLLEDNDLGALLNTVRKLTSGDSIVSRECVMAQLAMWLATYDMWRKGDGPGKIGTSIVMVTFFGQRLEEWSEMGKGGVGWMNENVPKDVRVVDLNPADHSAEMLEWATEIMAAAFRNVVDSVRPGKWGLCMRE